MTKVGLTLERVRPLLRLLMSPALAEEVLDKLSIIENGFTPQAGSIQKAITKEITEQQASHPGRFEPTISSTSNFHWITNQLRTSFRSTSDQEQEPRWVFQQMDISATSLLVVIPQYYGYELQAITSENWLTPHDQELLPAVGQYALKNDKELLSFSILGGGNGKVLLVHSGNIHQEANLELSASANTPAMQMLKKLAMFLGISQIYVSEYRIDLKQSQRLLINSQRPRSLDESQYYKIAQLLTVLKHTQEKSPEQLPVILFGLQQAVDMSFEVLTFILKEFLDHETARSVSEELKNLAQTIT
jgi:hypothetical protein